MLRATLNRNLLCSFVLPFHFRSNPFDINRNDNGNPDNSRKLTLGEISMDKLRNMFVDENNHFTREVNSVMSITAAGFIAGFVLGGTTKAKYAAERYIDENQATRYTHNFTAQKEVQKKFALELIRGGVPVGLKIGIFCFLFSSIATCLYVIRDKYTVVNFTCAGILTGCIMKINMGLKAACAGMLVGGVLGTLYGSMTSIVLYVTGIKMNDVMGNYGAWISARQKIIDEKSKEYIGEEEAHLRNMHKSNQELRKILEEKKETIEEKK